MMSVEVTVVPQGRIADATRTFEGTLDQKGAVGMPSEMPNCLRNIAVSRPAQPGEFHRRRL